MLPVALAERQHGHQLPSLVRHPSDYSRDSRRSLIHVCGLQHASVQAVAPEVKADDVSGFVERQHERQLLPVKVQGVW